MPSARDLITGVVSRGVVPLTKPAGFKRGGLNFHRRRGETVQVVNVQLSQGNVGSEGRFYVNVGIAFDALRTLEQRPIEERPTEPECHFRSRLERLVPGAPAHWTVSGQTDLEALAAELQRRFVPVVEDLDRIDSPAAFLAHPWNAGDSGLRARLQYVSGDHAGALESLRQTAERFQDRHGMTVAELIRRFGMAELHDPT